MTDEQRDRIEELEQYLMKQLMQIKRDYERAAEPILRELARLESMKPPKPFILSPDMVSREILDAAMPATKALLLECEQVPNIDHSPHPYWKNRSE